MNEVVRRAGSSLVRFFAALKPERMAEIITDMVLSELQQPLWTPITETLGLLLPAHTIG
jgi:hypothetical protein